MRFFTRFSLFLSLSLFLFSSFSFFGKFLIIFYSPHLNAIYFAYGTSIFFVNNFSDFMSKQSGVVTTPKNTLLLSQNVNEKLLINLHGNDYVYFLCIVSWLFPNFLCVFNTLCS